MSDQQQPQKEAPKNYPLEILVTFEEMFNDKLSYGARMVRFAMALVAPRDGYRRTHFDKDVLAQKLGMRNYAQ